MNDVQVLSLSELDLEEIIIKHVNNENPLVLMGYRVEDVELVKTKTKRGVDVSVKVYLGYGPEYQTPDSLDSSRFDQIDDYKAKIAGTPPDTFMDVKINPDED